jgi:hypothetical protein
MHQVARANDYPIADAGAVHNIISHDIPGAADVDAGAFYGEVEIFDYIFST